MLCYKLELVKCIVTKLLFKKDKIKGIRNSEF